MNERQLSSWLNVEQSKRDYRKEGTAVAQWLRCCASNQKVAGSIPAGVNGNFN